MRWFEVSMDLDTPLKECLSAWESSDCYPHLPTLLGLSQNNTTTPIHWDVAANSTENYTTLWWQCVDNGINVSGTVRFKHIHHNRQTRVTLSLSWITHLNEKTEFRLDLAITDILKQCLQQFKQQVYQSQLAKLAVAV